MPKIHDKGENIECNDRLALNLFDIEHIEIELREKLKLKDKLDFKNPVWVDRNKQDEYLMMFTCELLHAAIITDIVRDYARKNNTLIPRCYVFKKIWDKLSSNAILTLVNVVGKSELNPEYFNFRLPMAVWTPSKPKRIEL